METVLPKAMHREETSAQQREKRNIDEGLYGDIPITRVEESPPPYNHAWARPESPADIEKGKSQDKSSTSPGSLGRPRRINLFDDLASKFTFENRRDDGLRTRMASSACSVLSNADTVASSGTGSKRSRRRHKVVRTGQRSRMLSDIDEVDGWRDDVSVFTDDMMLDSSSAALCAPASAPLSSDSVSVNDEQLKKSIFMSMMTFGDRVLPSKTTNTSSRPQVLDTSNGAEEERDYVNIDVSVPTRQESMDGATSSHKTGRDQTPTVDGLVRMEMPFIAPEMKLKPKMSWEERLRTRLAGLGADTLPFHLEDFSDTPLSTGAQDDVSDLSSLPMSFTPPTYLRSTFTLLHKGESPQAPSLHHLESPIPRHSSMEQRLRARFGDAEKNPVIDVPPLQHRSSQLKVAHNGTAQTHHSR